MSYRNGKRPRIGRGFGGDYVVRNNDHIGNFKNEETKEEVQLRYPGLPMFVQNLEPHLVRMIRIVQANADIRRYTSLGIEKRLIDKGIITEGGNYIDFRWDKFTVKSKGINTDYRYTELVFLESFVASFSILANVAGKALENYCKIEFEDNAKNVIPQEKNGEDDEITRQIAARQLENDEGMIKNDDNKEEK